MVCYHDLITQKSWQLLQTLRKKYDFILIGDWAVFLYTNALKSKDIDLVMEHEEIEKLREEFDTSKNDRLKKYEARSEEVEIDIYVPFYSNPGLPAEELKKYVFSLSGFNLVEKEVLAILKEKAFEARSQSVKGKKDFIDWLSLLRLEDFDFGRYRELVTLYKVDERSKLAQRLLAQTVVLRELNLNRHTMSRLKKRIFSSLK